jgi:hypothetical protein
MKQLIQYLMVGVVFYWIYWFLVFESNPYTNCKEHPDRKLRAEYYYCEPFGFNLKKGFIDKSVPTPWMKDQKHVDYLKHQKDSQDSKEPENIDPSAYQNR